LSAEMQFFDNPLEAFSYRQQMGSVAMMDPVDTDLL